MTSKLSNCPSGWSHIIEDNREPCDPKDPSQYRLGVINHHFAKGKKPGFTYSIEYTYYDGSYSYIEWR